MNVVGHDDEFVQCIAIGSAIEFEERRFNQNPICQISQNTGTMRFIQPLVPTLSKDAVILRFHGSASGRWMICEPHFALRLPLSHPFTGHGVRCAKRDEVDNPTLSPVRKVVAPFSTDFRFLIKVLILAALTAAERRPWMSHLKWVGSPLPTFHKFQRSAEGCRPTIDTSSANHPPCPTRRLRENHPRPCTRGRSRSSRGIRRTQCCICHRG